MAEQPTTIHVATSKVYVVEVGVYSSCYINAIFTTRELAEAFVDDRERVAFERNGIKEHREVVSWSWSWPEGYQTSILHFYGDGRAVSQDGIVMLGTPTYRDIPAETFEEFLQRNDMNEFGDVEEYDVWDRLPKEVIG